MMRRARPQQDLATCLRGGRFRFLALALAFLLLPSVAFALEVKDVRWGFDGKVVPNRFNILSVLVHNPSKEPYDGVLILRKTDFSGAAVGAKIVEPCFLSPWAGRWIQFYPYVDRENWRWELRWGPAGRKRMNIKTPRFGPPAQVILEESGTVASRGAVVRGFPEDLFPPTVAATDGLHAVLLDHVPRWEPARRRAFLDWLRRGGAVHLLKRAGGGHPVFDGDLAVLNRDADRFTVGQGIVVRHDLDRSALNQAGLRDFPTAELREGEGDIFATVTQSFFSHLARMTRPKHNWAVIFVMLIVYLLLIGPVNYILGWKWRDFRKTIPVFIALVALFSLGLGAVGSRGYGETAAVHTLTYARLIDHRTCDVTQWSNAFVVDGADYEFHHAGAYNLYSTCEETEDVRGVIDNGRDGRFAVDMPVYSARTFMHRGVMKAEGMGLRITRWEGNATRLQLTLETGPGFPEKIERAMVLRRGRCHFMRQGENTLRCSGGGLALAEFLSPEILREGMNFHDHKYKDLEDEAQVLGRFRSMLRPLLSYALGGTKGFPQWVHRPPPPEDHADLFIFAENRDRFTVEAKDIGRELGFVLYHVRLFKPEVQ